MTAAHVDCPIHGCLDIPAEWITIRHNVHGPALLYNCPHPGHDCAIVKPVSAMVLAAMLPILVHAGARVTHDIPEMADPKRGPRVPLTEIEVERFAKRVMSLERITMLSELADVRAAVARERAGGL